MKQTGKQSIQDFRTKMLILGFAPTGDICSESEEIFERTWNREIDVLWYGKLSTSFTLKVCGGQFPALWIYRNGILEDVRRYRSCGYLLNALKLILECSGYEF